MSELHTPDNDMQDLLDAITFALQTNEDNVDDLIQQSRISRARINGLIDLIRSLHIYMSREDPSDKFVNSLRRDLMSQREGVSYRTRAMTPRMQLAAGFAVAAGFALVVRRRIEGEPQEPIELEAQVLQQQ
jgi:hypothetical protein